MALGYGSGPAWLLSSAGIFSSLLWVGPAFAQITPDSSLGTESSIVTPGTVQGLSADLIEGGAARGANLFHSFSDFNVNAGQSVYFANPTGIENILSRVTGGSISNIDGLLGVDGAANLFLLNPNGVVFGPDASLDVSGSFVTSTGSSFAFADGSEFNAAPTGNELLTVSVPIGVQFNDPPQGDITSTGNLAAGEDLTLYGRDLYTEGQLQAGGTLNLLGAGSVTIRDTVTNAFVASSDNKLKIQGDQVDIFALNHLNSGLFAGGDLVLRSDNPVIGDAHFLSGGNWQIERLDGTVGSLISPNDPIILAGGNVQLGAYIGASLHILAGGSVTLDGNIIISNPTGVNLTNSTINPNNNTVINGSGLTYAALATFQLPDYDVIVNADGTVSRVPVQRTIMIDGSAEATLDVRAGVDWAALGGLNTDPTVEPLGSATPTYPSGTLGAAITVNGNVRIDQPEGRVVLTNQFRPNGSLAAGIITVDGTGSINTRTSDNRNSGYIILYGRGNIDILGSLNSGSNSSSGNSGTGGRISISSEGNINVSQVSLNSGSNSFSGDAGIGGAITLSSRGNIDILGSLNSGSNSSSGNSGTGGRISISSEGNINVSQGSLNSNSNSSSRNSGTGGEILLFSEGNINVSQGSLNSYSFSLSGDAGTGGAITLSSEGNINLLGDLTSVSNSNSTGNSGTGGAITLSSEGNINLSGDLTSVSNSLSGNSGAGGEISISAGRNINVLQGSLESRSNSLSGDAGTGGAIALSSEGNINLLGDLISDSISANAGSSGTGGEISVFAEGNISLSGDLISSSLSNFGDAGTGGEVNISSGGTIDVSQGRLDSSSSSAGNSGTGGAITLSSEGNINLSRNLTSYSFAGNTGNSGTGGAVTLSSEGNINLSGDLEAYSFSLSGDVGTGGAITLATRQGSILGNNGRILTMAASQVGGATLDAGIVSIEVRDQISGLEVVTLSTNPDTGFSSGDVTIQGWGDLRIANVELQTSADAEIPNPLVPGQTITVTIGGLGQSGNATLSSLGSLTLDGTTIRSDANGPVPGGNITIENTETVILNNTRLETDTVGLGGRAGNILVSNVEVLAMRNDSLIISNAQGNGDGGNIIINADFLVASLNENNDILATADAGNGGLISIPARSILGFTVSPLADVSILQANRINDISSKSAFGTDGIKDTPNLEVDPSTGVNELPVDLSDRSNQITPGCGIANTDDGSSFVITGGGGLPPNPSDPISANDIEVDWITYDGSGFTSPVQSPTADADTDFTQAQAMVIDTDGTVHFVVDAAATEQASLTTPHLCAAAAQH